MPAAKKEEAVFEWLHLASRPSIQAEDAKDEPEEDIPKHDEAAGEVRRTDAGRRQVTAEDACQEFRAT